MKKNKEDQVNRMAFIQMCIEQPEQGANYIKDIASKIGQSKKTPEIIGHLKQILFISECTIYRDLEKF